MHSAERISFDGREILCSLSLQYGTRSLAFEKDHKKLLEIKDYIQRTPEVEKQVKANIDFLLQNMGKLYQTHKNISLAMTFNYHRAIQETEYMVSKFFEEQPNQRMDKSNITKALSEFKNQSIENFHFQTRELINLHSPVSAKDYRYIYNSLAKNTDASFIKTLNELAKEEQNPIKAFNRLTNIQHAMEALTRRLKEESSSLDHNLNANWNTSIFEIKRNLLLEMSHAEHKVAEFQFNKKDISQFIRSAFFVLDRPSLFPSKIFTKKEMVDTYAKVFLGVFKNPRMIKISESKNFWKSSSFFTEDVQNRMTEIIEEREAKY